MTWVGGQKNTDTKYSFSNSRLAQLISEGFNLFRLCFVLLVRFVISVLFSNSYQMKIQSVSDCDM